MKASPLFRIGSSCGLLLLAVVGASAGTGTAGPSLELEGFTEPLRTINIAAEESGIIDSVLVREGERVTTGQPLVRLNSDVHLKLLAIAEQNMNATGRLNAAQAELSLRRERFSKLESLRIEGHAREEEVRRAEGDMAVAESNVRAVQEELLTRKLEHDKLKIQYERRTIHSTFSGVVTTLHKQPGEFVAPNKPELLVLVELDFLLANFTMLTTQAQTLQVGNKLPVSFPTSSATASGIVEFIAPVTDAESGTVRVKVRIPNPDNRFRCGERCKIRL
jgi:RND family efflux transporter MFP subunit